MDEQAIRERNERRKALKAAASPPPWTYEDVPGLGWLNDTPDGRFVTAARSDPVEDDVDALLAEIDRLRAELDELREALRDVLHLPASSGEDAAILFTEGMSGPVHPPDVYNEARRRQAIRERAAALLGPASGAAEEEE